MFVSSVLNYVVDTFTATERNASVSTGEGGVSTEPGRQATTIAAPIKVTMIRDETEADKDSLCKANELSVRIPAKQVKMDMEYSAG